MSERHAEKTRVRMPTVLPLTRADICIGCGSCAVACPSDCVTISFQDHLGQYAASVDSGRCRECGVCARVCPFTDTGVKPLVDTEGKLFLSHAADRATRIRGASGGSVTQLLLSLVRSGEIDGALLVRPQTAKPILQEYFVARTEPEILGAQGSVYAPVSTAGIGSLISEHPGEARLALVGLPCVISGIRWLSQSKREALSNIALFVGLFCGRTPNLYATEYLLRRLKVSPSHVRRINYRSEGWPGNIQIIRVDDQVSEVPYKSTYGMKTLLSSNLFLPKACYFCNDALARYADIAWGDAWLHRLSDDNNGYSLAVCHTEKGKEVLHRYQAELSLQPLPRHDLFEAQGRLMHSKTVGYAHRLWLYLKLRPSLHGLLQPPKFTFSLPVLIRETAFMPVYLLSRRLGVFRWRRLPFPVLRFYKLMARVWR